jgi:hypothetical protein
MVYISRTDEHGMAEMVFVCSLQGYKNMTNIP